MYRFLSSRRWLVAGAVVVAAVLVMVQLGLWQLRRHDEVRVRNEALRERLALPARPIAGILPAGGDADGAAFRRVHASGTYVASAEVVLDNRSHEGSPGSHLLTPLATQDGRMLIVDRGWIPLRPDPEAVRLARAPSGLVTVEGVLFPSERKGVLEAPIPAEGRVTHIPRLDVDRIARQLGRPAYPLYLRLESQSPAQSGPLPVAPGLPSLDAGPHLSYAVQWFIFATLAVATFGALARREARRRGRSAPSTAA